MDLKSIHDSSRAQFGNKVAHKDHKTLNCTKLKKADGLAPNPLHTATGVSLLSLVRNRDARSDAVRKVALPG